MCSTTASPGFDTNRVSNQWIHEHINTSPGSAIFHPTIHGIIHVTKGLAVWARSLSYF
jgi:hypothetical protein